MDLSKLYTNITPDQAMTAEVIKGLQCYNYNGAIIEIASFPILTRTNDPKETKSYLDTFEKSIREVCGVLSLKHPQPNKEFLDSEMDELIDKAVADAKGILNNTSSISSELDNTDFSNIPKLKNIGVISLALIVQSGLCRLIADKVIAERNDITGDYYLRNPLF